jgi:hypothetical protein
VPPHQPRSIVEVLGIGRQVDVNGVSIPVIVPVLALILLLLAPMAAARIANRGR